MADGGPGGQLDRLQEAAKEKAEAAKKEAMTIGVTSFGKTNASDSSAMRYPKHQDITANSDYVTFEFYEYEPPFANEGGGTKKSNYSASVSDDILGTLKSGQRVIKDELAKIHTTDKTVLSEKEVKELKHSDQRLSEYD